MSEVTDELRSRVEARIRAYIHPNAPSDAAQLAALEAAVAFQSAYEAAHADSLDAVRRGVQRFTAGGYSETYFSGAGEGAALCGDARVALFNAGLLKRALPTARRF